MKFHVDIQPSGQTFDLDAGRTILDGALAEGLIEALARLVGA